MRLYFLMVCLLLFGISCNGSRLHEADSVPDECYYAYSGNFHEEIIKPETQAWQKVARLIYPRVCDDSETLWAARQADSLANVLLSDSTFSISEQIARLCEIQNTIAYGMCYCNAIIKSYTDPELSECARLIIQSSNSEIDSLRSDNYRGARMLVFYEQKSYIYFGMFMGLISDFSMGEPQYMINYARMTDLNSARIDVLFKNSNDIAQAYRYSSLINDTTFFMTLCPLTFLMAGDEFQQANQSEYMKIGGWFDSQVEELNEILYDIVYQTNEKSLPTMTLEEYSEIEKKSSAYRVRLIELFAEAIQTM